jgi:hypothetical protein
MLAVQYRLPLVPVQTRYVRRPFHPSQDQGAYRLPHAVRDRLASSLAPFRNRDAAFALAVFLARFWSVPGRVAGSFPIDRRALADHAGLGLTEARVRGAIRTLEAVGFLDRAIPALGSPYKATPDGPVANFGNGRESGWIGSDLPRGTQPENRAHPPGSRPADKLCDRPLAHDPPHHVTQ